MSTTPRIIQIKTYTISELAIFYGISNKTMSRWLKNHASRIGPRIGRYYNVRQIELIFELLGPPKDYSIAA
ncbi:MAG TPA: hypothetical protein VHK91_04870 [Flavisolibacter sp.]|jgi:hypothetical protein|nr:hypothetical protein [Flavisolibacter sp.]